MPAGERLTVLAIVDDETTAALLGRVLGPHGDRVVVATTLAEGLERAAAEAPDLAFVDVSLGRNAGLAMVHHLHALAPESAVYALARAEALEVGANAIALGGAGLLVMPPAGDEIATAAAEVRARRAEAVERERLHADAEAARVGAEVAARVATVVDARDRTHGARELCPILAEAAGAHGAAVYLPIAEGSAELARVAVHGRLPDSPAIVDEMGLVTWAARSGVEVVPLAANATRTALAVLAGCPHDFRDGTRGRVLDLAAAQGATALALLAEREKGARGTIKDPDSSAYTFAYFVDVAGREIDKARRYGRRFALATIMADAAAPPPSGDGAPSAPPSGPASVPSGPPLSANVADLVLYAVRDTDVLARVDEREFYLLLPETGGIGAHVCCRRVLEKTGARGGRCAGARAAPDVVVGVATYPHDGTDLSRLLRAARRRAEASRRSVVRTHALERMALGDVVDTLLWETPSGEAGARAAFDAPRALEASVPDAIALVGAAVADAVRGGAAVVAVANQPAGGLSASVRALLGRERDDVALHVLDVRGVPNCADLELVSIVAEHGAWALAGRSDGRTVRAVHAADPWLADLLVERLGQAAGVRLLT